MRFGTYSWIITRWAMISSSDEVHVPGYIVTSGTGFIIKEIHEVYERSRVSSTGCCEEAIVSPLSLAVLITKREM